MCCLGRICGTTGRLQQIYEEKHQLKKRSFVEASVLSKFHYQADGNHATELSTTGHVISEQDWKNVFDFPIVVNNYGIKYISHFSLKLYIQF